MLLYLTSTAAKTLDKLIPFLPRSPQEMKVAFIPTAGDVYEEKPWMESDREKLISLGFTVEDVDIKNKTSEELEQQLSDKDVIFVAGGSTAYLLEKAQESGFIPLVRRLVKEGKIYIGSSAGSLLAGPNIEVDRIYDEGEFGKILDSYDALNLVNFVVLPHADNPKVKPFVEKAIQEYGNKYELKKLNDNQAILITDNKTQMIEAE